MNERIREITGQVLDELVPETWVALGYDRIKEIQYRTAELIVQECVFICKEKERPNLYGVREVEARIKQHFGVE